MVKKEIKFNAGIIDEGDIGIFLSRVVLPQFCVFVAIVILGVFDFQLKTSYLNWVPKLGFPLLILYTTAVAVNFLVYLFVRIFAARISTFTLALQLFLLSFVLLIGSFLLEIDFGTTVFLPLGGAIIFTSFCIMGVLPCFLVIFPSVILASAISLIVGFVVSPNANISGYALLLGSFFVSLAVGWIRSKNFHQGEIFLISALLKRVEGLKDVPIQGIHGDLLRRMTSEFRWRFFPLLVVISTNSLVLGLFNEGSAIAYYAIWAVIVSVQLIVFYQSIHQKSLFNLQFLWFVAASSLILLWLHPFALGFVNISTVEVGFLLIMLSLGMMPWTWQFNLANTAGFFTLGGILSWYSQSPGLSVSLYLFLAVYLLFQNSRHFLVFSHAAIINPATRQLRDSQDSRTIAGVLGEGVLLMTDSSGYMALIGNDEEWTIIGSGKDLQEDDRSMIFDLVIALKERSTRCELLSISEINRLFHPLLNDWFGFLPNRLICFQASFRGQKDTDSIIGLLPASPTLRLTAWSEAEKQILGLLDTVDFINEQRRGFREGTKTFLSPFRDITAHDEELAEMIHHVNNAAQDLSAVGESVIRDFDILTRIRSEEKDLDASQTLQMQIKEGLAYLADTIRYLSSSVSDVKWLKEAGSSPIPEKFESIRLHEILVDLFSYAKFRFRKSAVQIKIDQSAVEDCLIHLESREFLEALLRAVIRIAGRALKSKDSLVLSSFCQGDIGGIRMSFTGVSHTSLYDIFKGTRDEEILRTLRRFVDNSRGGLVLEKSLLLSEGADITLSFKSLQSKPVAPAKAFGWALLIDDKPEIVNFYGSVAEALGLKFRAANNLKEAREFLGELGVPSIIVTDIQLDQENGLDFVREVRDGHGATVPIIVVSGNTEERIRDQVFSSGASKYLTKPVGRKKLFLEIKELLERQ